MIEGARNALAGYLFQLIGSAALRVRQVADADDAWAELLAVVGAGTLRAEEFGEDVVVRPDELSGCGMAVIQFKYSGNADRAIERSEFIEILVRLDAARREAAAGGEEVDRYVLISNRGLHASSQELYSQRNALEPPSPLRLRSSPTNKTRLRPFLGDADAAARAWHAILQKLLVLQATSEGQIERVRAFARRYGVLNSELGSAINTLAGALVLETASAPSVKITRESLKKNLVGDPRAAILELGSEGTPHLAELCRQRLDERLHLDHPVDSARRVPRQVLKDIRDELAQHPVVFVRGGGGCGKSLAVGMYLESICGQQVVWSASARDATERHIVDSITLLRLPDGENFGRDRSLEEFRARLATANPGAEVLWTIDLDGVDEAQDRRTELTELIRRCWNEGRHDGSPASLLVSCRAASPTEMLIQVSAFLGAMEPARVLDRVGVVNVDEFSDDELADAAALCDGPPEERILRALRADTGLGVTPDLGEATQVREDVLESLHHPVVWGHYSDLDESRRSGVLDGDPASLGELASRVLDRFFLSCRNRRLWSDPRHLRDALTSVARVAGARLSHPVEQFEDLGAPVLGGTESSLLYAECESYGLVGREKKTYWRWRHQFLVDCLAGSLEGEVHG